MALGANVIAIDLDRDFIWKRLINIARNSCGTLTFTLNKEQSECTSDEMLFKSAGTNLFTKTPEIRNWVQNLYPDEHLILGGYAYLDGALFLKVSIAMDAIIAGLMEKRKIGMAFLCSPTDVFVRSNEAHKYSVQKYKNAPFWQTLISNLTFGKSLVRNQRKKVSGEMGKEFSIIDGIVVAQGPNYALSKRIQHWRCMIAHETGYFASSNIAPSTATASVVSNKSFAAAYGGMYLFPPMEVMMQDTSNSVMAALLIHDIRNKKSVSYPSTKLSNPLLLFTSGSFHGGIWRMAWKMTTIGTVSALSYVLKMAALPLVASTAAISGAVAYCVVNGAPHTWF